MYMIRRILIGCVCLLCSVAWETVQAKKTVLSAEIYGYRAEMVYFDCFQTPLLRQEFHTNPGEEHIYSFDTERMVTFAINGKTTVLLMPGDSLHVNLRYEGKQVQAVEFSGTAEAVAQNRLLRDIAQLKRTMRYKSQLLACIAVDVKPKERFEASRVLLEQSRKLLEKAGKEIRPEVSSYILADIEGSVYNSFMEYPVMYAETRRLPIEKQEIGDYWSVMDGYSLRTDKNALQSLDYIGMLMRYMFFVNEKKAHESGTTYTRPTSFEEGYRAYAAFYTGDVRDVVLYTIICNFIRNGKNLDRIDDVVKEYKKKYNRNKEYIHIIETLLQ
ncbi:hypothetical protein IR149_16465 [Bacteroides acidifaciens]|uniref:DUF4369 domain-containing protein n=3 Tax=Bacteroides TaxID=816 RepID=A0A1C7GXS2_9BACE|nr:hypothetical protein A4V03_01290 [Bacteroides caecimuris]MBF0731091.1 hypothetical protein [Bacteroides acidifaciens]MBF0836405.1 hypothetical protein [Bacteroides acidifaciens]NDO54347.1 hypothetical protein [Bacteroides acidifaciens]OXE61162.1 hypothetical protein ADH74_19340 [Bacteroides caecimuris]